MKNYHLQLPDEIYSWLVTESARTKAAGRPEPMAQIVIAALQHEKERREK